MQTLNKFHATTAKNFPHQYAIYYYHSSSHSQDIQSLIATTKNSYLKQGEAELEHSGVEEEPLTT